MQKSSICIFIQIGLRTLSCSAYDMYMYSVISGICSKPDCQNSWLCGH